MAYREALGRSWHVQVSVPRLCFHCPRFVAVEARSVASSMKLRKVLTCVPWYRTQLRGTGWWLFVMGGSIKTYHLSSSCMCHSSTAGSDSVVGGWGGLLVVFELSVCCVGGSWLVLSVLALSVVPS